jgi:hypothetical protein
MNIESESGARAACHGGYSVRNGVLRAVAIELIPNDCSTPLDLYNPAWTWPLPPLIVNTSPNGIAGPGGPLSESFMQFEIGSTIVQECAECFFRLARSSLTGFSGGR